MNPHQLSNEGMTYRLDQPQEDNALPGQKFQNESASQNESNNKKNDIEIFALDF